MLEKFLIIFSALAVVGCTSLGQPSMLRRPALERLSLVEGLNIVDRAPLGVSLAAKVLGNEITDWRVFNGDGVVTFQQRSDNGISWSDACELSGGFPQLTNNPLCAKSCCWENWGCLCCTEDEQDCTMRCDTQKCKGANGQALPPVFPEDPEGRPSVAVNPDRLVIAVDPVIPGWSVLDAAGQRMYVATRRTEGVCPICISAKDDHICWELPCLPAKINASNPY